MIPCQMKIGPFEWGKQDLNQYKIKGKKELIEPEGGTRILRGAHLSKVGEHPILPKDYQYESLVSASSTINCHWGVPFKSTTEENETFTSKSLDWEGGT